MTFSRQIFLTFLVISAFGQIFASTDGIIGVISPRIMYDGRPVLWQNLQSDSSLTVVHFFQGDRYNFFGLLNGNDSSHVYAGLNTAGFGIVFSSKMDDNDDSETMLIKQALGECGRLEDFERLLAESSVPVDDNSSFACIDAFGVLKLFESDMKALDPFDLKNSPDGFLVRANFNFTKLQTADDGFWRYHRAREIILNESRKSKLQHHNVIKTIARDLESIAVEPYPLPFTGSNGASPSGYVECKNSINQFNTVSCVVIHGVRPGENPDFSTMWVILGEPNCGIPVPLWPATSQIPLECGYSDASLNEFIQMQKRRLYDAADLPDFINTRALVDLRAKLNPIENEIFAETRKALSRWHEQTDYLQDMIDFQMTTAMQAARSLSK